MSGLTPQIAAAGAGTPGATGGGTPGATITDLAQQHGVRASRSHSTSNRRSRTPGKRTVSRRSTNRRSTELFDHASDHNQGAGTDGPAAEKPASAGYTATAQLTAARGGASGSISILA